MCIVSDSRPAATDTWHPFMLTDQKLPDLFERARARERERELKRELECSFVGKFEFKFKYKFTFKFEFKASPKSVIISFFPGSDTLFDILSFP